MALGKLTIVIGAGIVGSILSKEGGFLNIADLFSSTLKIVGKTLQQDRGNSKSMGKPQNDSLLAQVNNLRQELQLLASSRSVTIVTGNCSGSRIYGATTIVVVGVVGYGYIWWKGWKFSDLMFVTRRGFSDAYVAVGKQLEQVSSSISSARRHLSSRIDHVDNNINECRELTVATKDEVTKLHGELSEFHVEVESVHREVRNLETQLGRIEGNQDFATRGVYHLCEFVQSWEQRNTREQIQASSSVSRPVLELSQTIPMSRTVSSPPLTLAPPSPCASVETPKTLSSPPLTLAPPSPCASVETPKVLRSSTAVSASGLKELQEVSNAIRPNNWISRSAGPNIIDGSNRSLTSQQPSGSSSSGLFGFKLPSISILTRSRSAAG